jgi:predicted class III extradiol MEMO1 family dioxygenase
MNVEEFKTYICGLIDEAYHTAKEEFSTEIMFPFFITLKANDQVEFHPIGRGWKTAKKAEELASH